MLSGLASPEQIYEQVYEGSEKEAEGENPESMKMFDGMVASSRKMQEVFDFVRKVADSDSTVIVYGESGTGKELVARALHNHSNRKNEPFVAINCGAIPENLLESELFGHVRGAFTGATSAKAGKFERADGGTIFLDEIGDMSPDLQVKVLRVLEEKAFDRVGGSKTTTVDVRVIAATHRDLEERVAEGSFREDLFYRLHVIPVVLPPLRERESDIPLLFDYFREKYNREKNKHVSGIMDDALEIMKRYTWPGNVREFRNLVERLVVLKEEGQVAPADLSEKMKRSTGHLAVPNMHLSDEGICLNTAVSEFEKALIYQSLQKTQWIKNKAAKLLQLNRTTLVEKIKRHNLQQC